MGAGPSVSLNFCAAVYGKDSRGAVLCILSPMVRVWLCDQETGGPQGTEGRESPETWDPG